MRCEQQAVGEREAPLTQAPSMELSNWILAIRLLEGQHVITAKSFLIEPSPPSNAEFHTHTNTHTHTHPYGMDLSLFFCFSNVPCASLPLALSSFHLIQF